MSPSLIKLGEKLSKAGPHKKEATPRRVRGLFGGEWIFNTLKAVYVWEHPYYPYFYIPHSEFKKGILKLLSEKEGQEQDQASSDSRGFRLAHLLGPHPKDPYKRIETLPSSRKVRIEVDGQVVAESSQNIFLFETMLRPRYYLNPGDVKWELLEESGTISYCPYKGMANYYNLKVNGKEIKDAVWYYKYPTAESALIAGRLCFYNEKVDVFIDGVKEEKYADARL
ncbi:DUF427-domain-containing protein [Acephala macrosclerotiorum]|nr:DUF427-domain-containing protein [Acephala macrosclerotiorum]